MTLSFAIRSLGLLVLQDYASVSGSQNLARSVLIVEDAPGIALHTYDQVTDCIPFSFMQPLYFMFTTNKVSLTNQARVPSLHRASVFASTLVTQRSPVLHTYHRPSLHLSLHASETVPTRRAHLPLYWPTAILPQES